MSKLSEMAGQELSRRASKSAVDRVWKQKNGTSAYCLSGWIIAGCGLGWFLLSIIPLVCKTSIREWLWMPIIGAVQLILGLIFVILSKKSEKFKAWANRDFEKSLKKKKKLEEKVKVGKRTLPITNGDVLALKIIGVLAAVLIAVLVIGAIQGWVE